MSVMIGSQHWSLKIRDMLPKQNETRPGCFGGGPNFSFDTSYEVRAESDFVFPNRQLTAFAQGIWAFAANWSVTLGVRWGE